MWLINLYDIVILREKNDIVILQDLNIERDLDVNKLENFLI